MTKIKIEYEHYDYPDNPRERDPEDKMVCFHGRYDLGDKHYYDKEDFKGWEDLKNKLEEDGAKVILPLYLYDHSGLKMNTTGFTCGWDSGKVGFIYMMNLPHGGCPTVARTRMEKSVELYSAFLEGEVYEVNVLEGSPCVHQCPHCDGDLEGEMEWEITESYIEYGYKNLEACLEDLSERYPDAKIINMEDDA